MYQTIFKGIYVSQISYQQTLVDVLWALLVAKATEVTVYDANRRTTVKKFHSIQEWAQEYSRLFADMPVVLTADRITL